MARQFNNFRELVADFSNHPSGIAISIRRFIKIERLNYNQLQKKVYQAADLLQSLKVQKGDRIMIVAPNSPEWVIVFLAAQILGIVVVAVDMSTSLETINNFATITTPKLVFRSAAIYKELDNKYSTIILEDVLEKINNLSSVLPSCKLTGEEGTVIVFTSGTTADPKGVVLSQHNILSNLSATQEIFKVLPSWRFLSVLPLSHMYELTVGCLLPLYAGGSIFYLPRVTPLAISRALKECHITVIAAVPQLAMLMLQKIERTAEQHGRSAKLESAFKVASFLPHFLRRKLFKEVHNQLGGDLDILALGGAPVDPEIARKWELIGVKVVQGYGLTETSPILAANVIPQRRLDSQGMMLPNVDWKLSDDGELLVKGPNVFNSYYNNPEATKAAFTADGYFKTGDIGRVDRDNWLHIFGRAKFAIVLSSGLKVFPEDVEAVAQKNKMIRSICVIGVKTSSSEIVEAVVVSDKTDQEIDTAIAQINGQIESFQHIDRWVRWADDDFPRNRLLKVERKLVQAWANNHEKIIGESSTAQKKVDDPLLQIMAKVLDKPVGQVGQTDKLSDIGLDSLRRLAVVSMIEEQLGIAIAEAAITQNTTLADVRKLIETAPVAAPDEVRPAWPYRPASRMFGNLIRDYFLLPLSHIWVMPKVIGSDNIAKLQTPALIVFNHIDYFDGAVLYGSLPKKIRNKLAIATGDDVLRDFKGLGTFTRLAFAGFNFARKEPILPSLKYTADLVDRGWSIAISPEGKLSKDGRLQEFKSGIGLLAVELGTPVVCVTTKGLFGTMSWGHLMPKKHKNVTVNISKPISFGRDVSYDEATQKIREIALNQLGQ